MAEYIWTSHARYKMNHYRLSESRVKRVISSPLRREVGIADGTVAMMQKAGTEKHPYEIWVMINKSKVKGQMSHAYRQAGKVKIISAWRYPGITKPGEPLPKEILSEMRDVR